MEEYIMKKIIERIADVCGEILVGGVLVAPYVALHFINALMSPVSKIYLAYVR